MTEEKNGAGRKRRTRAEIDHARRLSEVRREFAEGRMPLLLRRYLTYCGRGEEELSDTAEGKGKRGAGRAARLLPNPAGFCRFLSLEREAYASLEREFPTEAGRMRAVFEDEALNSDLPASVLGFYLKHLFGDDDGEDCGGAEGGDILVTFSHDILADGR